MGFQGGVWGFGWVFDLAHNAQRGPQAIQGGPRANVTLSTDWGEAST